MIPNNTLGTVEIGGASAQVAFVADVPLPDSYTWNLTVGNVNYTVYAYSYMGFGTTEARYSINETLYANQTAADNGTSGNVVIYHPCFNVNYTETVVITHPDGSSISYYLIGTGKYYECYGMMALFFFFFFIYFFFALFSLSCFLSRLS